MSGLPGCPVRPAKLGMQACQVTLDRQASRIGRRSDLDRLGIQPRSEGEANQIPASLAVMDANEIASDFIFLHLPGHF